MHPLHSINKIDRVANAYRRGVLTEVRLGLTAARARGEIGGKTEAHMPLGLGEEVDLFERPILLEF